ncbi:MAG TPA: phosphoribosylaminoimidazolesuccinocarboxamide synthase [Gammaproteobacteria bacterium]|nr:phosphoribosylaminoimidazolesuccinocarboxamide synthase [Xanthomonadales bacterium]HOP22799.1 phosphoribosylaminoimidazolesuccinocarboxamide synthase [Gammaproteobacteria bacterium]HPI95247.1 phosphoribosylaminoimidazolesuccinocarboxamide synthase [Gammaproteobacteria bacterium]HPQ87330.1 phosphoribosylaminoimidazolesuccinocarboxamide synthase [Gammaproteobacteria bacterium]
MINLPLIHKGKVRDVYQVDDKTLLMVASDRLSAFDVVLPDVIPQKGQLLTQISNFWFDMSKDLITNHLTAASVKDVIGDADNDLQARSVVVKKLKALPVEAIVRGYIIGSGWKDYQKTGEICGIQLPENLQQAEKLPEPIFTPSSKAAVGDHDENISFQKMIKIVGEDLAEQVRDVSIKLYQMASEHALSKGIIIADTKFEFGLDENDNLVLMDEILTPDSSRFWNLQNYKVGTSPDSYDKQFVRDYLETLDWDKTPPGPHVPVDIIEATANKYREAFQLITGREFI